MSSNNSRTPPPVFHSKSCNSWLKLFRIWHIYTELPKRRQSPALVLSIEREAQDPVLEIPEDGTAKENGVDSILHRLDRLFKKVSTKHLKHLNVLVTCLFNHCT